MDFHFHILNSVGDFVTSTLLSIISIIITCMSEPYVSMYVCMLYVGYMYDAISSIISIMYAAYQMHLHIRLYDFEDIQLILWASYKHKNLTQKRLGMVL